MKKILIINGYPNSGKTEFEKYLTKFCNTIIYSSIKPVKNLTNKYFDYDGEKTEEYRRILSQLKLLLEEEFNYITDKISEVVKEFYRDINCELLLIDIREPDQIEKFKNYLRAETVFIVNDNIKKIISNDSDANVENYKYDYYIENNGSLEELEGIAEMLVKWLKEGK